MAKERRGFWSKIFKKPEKNLSYSLEDILSGVVPIYSSGFGNNIYASDVVQQAIYSIVTELKKLDPAHIRSVAGSNDFISVGGAVQNVLDAPNPLMTTSDFIEKVAWNLLLNYNAFIYPLWDGDTLAGLYPLQPKLVEFDADYGGTGKTWVRFHFANGLKTDLPYEDIIHLRYRFSMSDYMGGNEQGQPDFKPLLDTLKLNDTLLKGLAKSLNIQTSINGVAKLKTMVNTEDQIAKVKEFEKKLQSNESGILPLDISAEYIPITKQVQLLDNTVLEFIDRKILRTFGVSIAIVNGDYTAAQYEAFYQKTIEPIIIQLSQEFTRVLFTPNESGSYGHKVQFFAKELIFMSVDQKIKMMEMLAPTGAVYENEKRAAFGYRPLPELVGKRYVSLNWVDAEHAAEYQVGEKDGDKPPDDNNAGGAENAQE